MEAFYVSQASRSSNRCLLCWLFALKTGHARRDVERALRLQTDCQYPGSSISVNIRVRTSCILPCTHHAFVPSPHFPTLIDTDAHSARTLYIVWKTCGLLQYQRQAQDTHLLPSAPLPLPFSSYPLWGNPGPTPEISL